MIHGPDDGKKPLIPRPIIPPVTPDGISIPVKMEITHVVDGSSLQPVAGIFAVGLVAVGLGIAGRGYFGYAGAKAAK